MARRQKHWLWEAFIGLAAEGGRTEPQGREFLKQTFPSLSHVVDAVISVQGRTDQLDAALADQWDQVAAQEEAALTGQSMDRSIREYARNTDGRFAGKGGAEGATDERDLTRGLDLSGDMNAQIRQRAAR